VWQRAVASQTVASLPTFVGVQIAGRYVTPEGAVLAPYSRLSWVHEFEPDRRVSPAFVTLPGASFTVNGARIDTGAKLTPAASATPDETLRPCVGMAGGPRPCLQPRTAPKRSRRHSNAAMGLVLSATIPS
jgi:hypothetical protein